MSTRDEIGELDGGRPGRVYLVGAGPGDPGLMTLRALELIRRADAIFYDRLIPAGALAEARPDALRVYVGKSPKTEADVDGGASQEEIIDRLIEAASKHRIVVRLKGGDPFVFGRGGEEAAALRRSGIPFEVVPGVTAGVAGPAYAGIPVTHRNEAGAVAFVTGHPAREERTGDCDAKESDKESAGDLDWQAVGRFPGTLVLYMGVRRMAENCAALIEAGRDPNEPAAVIESATLPRQRVIRASLSELADAAAKAEVRAPALVVIGRVAEHAEELAWFEPGPLAGRRVTVTRARAQAGSIAGRLRDLGAEVVELPLIRIEPQLDQPEVAETIHRIAAGDFDLLCLTSVNGVELLFQALAREGLDARALAGLEVAAIGPATLDALAAHGIRADHIPNRPITESLIETLEGVQLEGRSALIAGAADMRPKLSEALTSQGATVTRLILYRTDPEPTSRERLESALDADFLTLASASAARNLARALRETLAWDGNPDSLAMRARILSIGPITSAAAREEGLPIHAEATLHTIDGLIQTLRNST